MKVKLSDAFDLQMGKTPSRNEPSYWGGAHKWVSIADLGKAEKYIGTTKERVTDEGIEKSGMKAVPKGTVIMSFKLSIGKTAITAEDMFTNEAIMAFIDKGAFEINADYLYYLCSGADWTDGANKAVLGLTLNKAALSQKEIEIPPLERQLSAVRALDKVSALIAFRKRQLAKLDELVKARFVELFGDPISNPKKWCKKSFAESCEIITGNTPSRKHAEYYGRMIEWIKSDNICQDKPYLTQAAEYLSNTGMSIGRTVDSGSILMTCIAGSLHTIGNVAIVNRKVAFNQQINAFVPKKFETWFLYYLLRLIQPVFHNATNQALKCILTKGNLLEINVIVPPLKLQERFAAFAERTEQSRLAIREGLRKLETLKASLMQQYFR